MAPASNRVHAPALEQRREKIPLSDNRDEMLPDLYWAFNHPQLPIPNRCLVFEIDLSPENMKKVHDWEEKQEVPNFATDDELNDKGSFELNLQDGKVIHIFSRGIGSTNAWDDALQAWFTPSELFGDDLKDNLRTAIGNAMGPKEHITLDPPVRQPDGTWTGGLAIERGAKPVKPNTRCYTLANSYQAPKGTWSPASNAKINGAFDANNLLHHDLIIAAAAFGQFSTEQAPPEVYEDMKNHAEMLNIPPLGIPGNFGYQTLQGNIAPTEKYGSANGLSKSIGPFGRPHRDKHDSAGRFTNMLMYSSSPGKYIIGKFYIPRLGIHITLRNFDCLNFCGLNIHGGSPSVAPEGEDVAHDAFRLTLIAYPPAAMGDGLSHVAVAALPDPKNPILKMTAEMQNLDCESRRHRMHSTRANFAQDGQVTNDVRSHVTFMARLFLLFIIFLSNQLPLFYAFRINSDQFLQSLSFEVGGVREAVGIWENGPGFRDPNSTHVAEDGSSLVAQDTIRSVHKRRWRLHYNKLARHIPFAVVHGMAYEIDVNGNLLEDMDVDDGDLGTDARGIALEKGGRPWKKPAAPISKAKATAREASKRRSQAASALKAGGTGIVSVGLRRSGRKKVAATGSAATNVMHDLVENQSGSGAIWTSHAYITVQDTFSFTEPQAGHSKDVVDPSNFNPPLLSLDDVDDPMAFIEATVDQQDHEIKFLRRLNDVEINRDFLAVVTASEELARGNQISQLQPHLELAFSGLTNNPLAVETCVHISKAWPELENVYASEAETTLALKLDRQSIMHTTALFWTWLDGYCVDAINHALENAPVTDDWIARLTRRVQVLLKTRGRCELKSSDVGAADLHGTYLFKSPRTLDSPTPADIRLHVIDIIASWLNFPIESDSRTKAWFIQAIYRYGHSSALYLDSTWTAFCHPDVEVFARRKDKNPPSITAYNNLSSALQKSFLCNPTSPEYLMIVRIAETLTSFRNSFFTTNTIAHPAPPPLLTPADDAGQLHFMHRFLDYLLELEPLIDGVPSPATLLQASVNQRRDYLLPFREHGPSRIYSRGAGRAFDPAHAKTKEGLFSGLIFRGVTFAAPFGLQAAKTFFSEPGDWDTESSLFPNPPPNFFCNPFAYSQRKAKRDVSLVQTYWDALNDPSCSSWEKEMQNGQLYAFEKCYNFLKGGSPTRFREIGALTGFLLTADFVYAGAVVAPTIDEVGKIIHGINRGGVKGLELLHLIHVRDRGSGRAYNKANLEEVRAKFDQLFRFLDDKLTAAQKIKMVFDAIMVENGLCKFSRAVKQHWFAIVSSQQ